MELPTGVTSCRWNYMQVGLHVGGTAHRWNCLQVGLPAGMTACRWNCPQVELYAGGTACRWNCLQVGLPAGRTACRWDCLQVEHVLCYQKSTHRAPVKTCKKIDTGWGKFLYQKLHSFLTPTLGGDQWSASRSDSLITEERVTVTR